MVTCKIQVILHCNTALNLLDYTELKIVLTLTHSFVLDVKIMKSWTSTTRIGKIKYLICLMNRLLFSFMSAWGSGLSVSRIKIWSSMQCSYPAPDQLLHLQNPKHSLVVKPLAPSKSWHWGCQQNHYVWELNKRIWEHWQRTGHQWEFH